MSHADGSNQPGGSDADASVDARLGSADADALDALIECGYDPSRVPEPHRARARRVAETLGLLAAEGPATDQGSDLPERTLRTIRAEVAPRLDRISAEALDAWMLAQGTVSRVPASRREHAARHAQIADLLARGGPAWTPDEQVSLTERTLAGVQSAIDTQQDRLVLPPRRLPRLADLVSLAAVVLIGVGIFWPVLAKVQQTNQRVLCHSNLGRTSMAMDLYASDNRAMLPIATAGFGSAGSWWSVGEPERSNSANLYTLYREGYAAFEDLACPGNEHAALEPEQAGRMDWQRFDQISYSYQLMNGPRPVWNGLHGARSNRTVVLADRSPVVLRAIRNQPVFPRENSRNHGGRGQHLLHTDGSVSWAVSPILETGDNIWLPRSVEQIIDTALARRGIDPLHGTERPASDRDTFLGP